MFDYLRAFVIIATGLLLSWQVFRKCGIWATPVLLMFLILADPRLHGPKVVLVTHVLRPLGIGEQVAGSRVFDAVWTLLPAVVVALLSAWIAVGFKRLRTGCIPNALPECHRERAEGHGAP